MKYFVFYSTLFALLSNTNYALSQDAKKEIKPNKNIGIKLQKTSLTEIFKIKEVLAEMPEILASFNNGKIIKSEISLEFLRIIENYLLNITTISQKDIYRISYQFVRNKVRNQLLYNEASKLGFTPNEEVIANEIKIFFSRPHYKEILQLQGYTEETYKEDIRKNNIISQWTNFLINEKVKITPQDIKNYRLRLHSPDLSDEQISHFIKSDKTPDILRQQIEEIEKNANIQIFIPNN